jgi:ABC-type microcin C transport system duplicated ATPase subunit YejF
MEPLLIIKDLEVAVHTHSEHKVLVDISELSLESGEILALVGETGSGKSLTASSILRLFPSRAIGITRGTIHFAGDNILAWGKQKRKELYGKEIAMIFQDPQSALNPAFRVGTMMTEIIRTHRYARRTGWYCR